MSNKDLETPQHTQRLKETAELKDRKKLSEIVKTAFFYRGVKVLEARWDRLGNMKTRYVMNTQKNSDAHKMLKEQLDKFKKHIAENEIVLKDENYSKGVTLRPGQVYV